MTIVAWFSGGITSAVACKLACDTYPDVEIVFIETGSHHPDLLRFLKDCEKWFNKPITVIQHETLLSVEDVIRKYRFINSPNGARCTATLKSDIRKKWEKTRPDVDTYVWGFESGAKEENRAKRIVERQPDKKHLFPLIDAKMDKQAAIDFVQNAGIEIPTMYKLGYNNNNCFVGNETFVTTEGIKDFESNVGKKFQVLTTEGWREGIVESHGTQSVWEVTLERNGSQVIINTTQNHEWTVPKYVHASQGTVTCKTVDLPIGKFIPFGYLAGKDNSIVPDLTGIQNGIIFGDGALYNQGKQARAHLCGEKKSLIQYFPEANVRENKLNVWIIHGFDPLMKSIPSISASAEYKLGFMIGLIATDGCVSRGMTTISNASKDNLEKIREIAQSLGWAVGEIKTKIRSTNYKENASLSSFTISNDNLKAEWIVRDKHRALFADKRTKAKGFKIVSVKPTERTASVYCLFVPEVHNFTLGCGALTMNCLGCVKGGMAYWNKIRVDFPEVFDKMAKLEREIGAKCLKSYYLDELPPDAGRGQKPLVTECGSTGEGCEIEKMRWYNTRD